MGETTGNHSNALFFTFSALIGNILLLSSNFIPLRVDSYLENASLIGKPTRCLAGKKKNGGNIQGISFLFPVEEKNNVLTIEHSLV